jgi:hypothetical protein
MFWFPLLCLGFWIICFVDLYEVNDLRLMIPALQFQSEGVMYTLRVVYLTLVFMQMVITIPILEQRFFFIFMSNLISEMGFIKKLENLGDKFRTLAQFTKRNGVLNQAVVFSCHLLTYNATIWMNFGENRAQFWGVYLIVAFCLLRIHILRAKYGIVASITGQVIMNFGIYMLLFSIYFSDALHKGFTAEQHTTLKSNAIDFIFGQNEDYAANL